MENELPEGWILAKVNEYFELVKDKIEPAENTSLSYVGLEHLMKGGGIDVTGNSDELKSTKSVFQKGDVLYGKLRPYLNKHAFVNFNGVCSTDILVFRSKENSNNKYLNYYLGTTEVISYANENSQGINLPRVSGTIMGNLEIPLPPLAEQTRIVAKLDTAFGHLETLKMGLARIPELLKKFRQTVLTQAVTGKLTEEWREENPHTEDSKILLDRIFEYKQEWAIGEALKGNSEARRLLSRLKHAKEISPENIPDKWLLGSLYDVCHLVVDCHNKTAPYEPSGIYLVRTTNVKNGQIILEDIRYISEETYDYWARRCPPMPGDIIFTREAPMGEAAIIPDNMQICLGQRTMLLRMPGNLLLNKYLLYTLLAPTMNNQIKDKAVGMGVEHLRVGDVESLMIPLPPLEEQQVIVNRVEALFAKSDAIEAQYQSLKAKIDQLPQALLAKAFRGELVQQDPTDEPASVLLEKIKGLTEAVGGKKKTKAGQTSLAFMEE